MRRLWNYIKKLLTIAKSYISPMFVVLFIASFTLWYIAKLNYNYTTELDVKLKISGQRFSVPCVVEGKGTNLVGYSLYASRRINIPLSELAYDTVAVIRPSAVEGAAADTLRCIKINPASLRDAISVRFSDLKIRSVGEVPDMNIEEER